MWGERTRRERIKKCIGENGVCRNRASAEEEEEKEGECATQCAEEGDERLAKGPQEEEDGKEEEEEGGLDDDGGDARRISCILDSTLPPLMRLRRMKRIQ